MNACASASSLHSLSPAVAPQEPYLLEVLNVSKGFPGVVALANVQLRVRPGTVLALMGENGAGKSTLMKIIAGIYQPDSGELRLKGRPVTFATPLAALQAGIAMIHQELNLMPHMSIAENIWIGREQQNRLGLIDHREMHRCTAALLARLRIELDPEEQVGNLSIAERQMVEIAKAVSYDSDVLIMDEPTSAITDKEVAHLFSIIADLKAQGKGIVYITHKMNEVFAIADEVAVFRDGAYIGLQRADSLDGDSLISMMVGRELSQLFPLREKPIGELLLKVRDLRLDGVFKGVSFDLHAGEILGIAGLMGSGRTNVAETLFGITPSDGGEIVLDGQPLRIGDPHRAIEKGLALLTEDRKLSGLFPCLSVLENMEVAVLPHYAGGGFVQQKALRALCEDMCRKLRVKTPSLEQCIDTLSGGNQQKALLARWLMTQPRILILDEPTRGIDVGAKAEIYRLIASLAGEGMAVIMISSELPEVLGMSDRVMVMHEGQLMGTLDRNEATQERVMQLASGLN
ncbi:MULTISPECIES: sugar ABC transporter ATP-binding protein [Pseudomonas]|jgi:inositol transport system ATP-binding protein|uniref:Putative ribose/galactose/methyl galactoside import ATP-binding protein n=2 Tax=Pseudomonas protegens TaxID=380021 RepID=RGMG_PSEF5|nr:MULTISPECIES: sugar ABC transporter ATP-binding protein [Pseudomonas]Q4KDI2.1 RecName: Full=Putative ribose/galactose/methyl galactoside import ATP-binding protein [Pseudomonas protegens Pf-5]AAY91867.1 ribose ABC transporter, ATP-binding protein [Pseudomonas protegens Pf-5]ASE23896.1 D-xylose ABC transporter ATP-binding protein [Pseudomonas protegens]PNV95474.1 D-xylose ABC transporter ATP-binding protein [Pseudomonas protegens]QEZ55486.1 sugar ABC transporter ATP-binding protein [Pseudomo